jgi:hypothetical protein
MKSLFAMLGRNLLLVLIVISAMVIAYGMFKSQPRQRAAQPEPAARYQPAQGGPLTSFQPVFDFGNISMAAGKVSHSYPVRNAGASTIRVTKLFTSCMCTEATLITPEAKAGPFGMPGHGYIPNIAVAIPSGESAKVEIVFDPAAHGPAGVGRIDRIITLQTDVGQPLELGFTAMVRP